MAEIKAGDEISAAWWPEAVQVDDGTDNLDVTSVTYIPGTPEVGVTFVAPMSGRVGVFISGEMREEAAGNRVYISFQLYQGTSAAGTLIQAARDEFGVSTNDFSTASHYTTIGNMTMIDGLVPGATHYVRTVHRVDSGTTSDVGQRRVGVIPLG